MTIRSCDFRSLYDGFNAPIAALDCGRLCEPFNPSGKPFCCDICRAVPVAYRQEWDYLKRHTSLWHKWRGEECPQDPTNPADLHQQTPAHLLLLACAGPEMCERDYRAISCRQFPFVPYITSDFRFIGLACDWDFTDTCWVLSHLDQVTSAYRSEFVATYDHIFSTWLEDLDSYSELSEEMREHYSGLHRRFPLLHRNGKDYMVNPESERLRKIDLATFPKFNPYKNPKPD